MGRINQDYATDSTVTGDDKVIGTDAADGSTKNYTIDGIKDYMQNNFAGSSDSYTSLDGKTVTVSNGLTTSVASASIPTDGAVTAGDLLRGVDSADGLVKNYTVDSIKDYTLSGGATNTIYTSDTWVIYVDNGVIKSFTPGAIPLDTTVSVTDLLRGTDSGTGLTRNYTLQSIKDLILTSGATGSFTARSGETVTVVDGVIVSIEFDADALAYINLVGITDDNDKSAVNQLVIGLKNAGIWSKIHQFMPLCWNDPIKNQYDLKLSQNVGFYGGITHASGYVQGNGTNGYIDTNINPTTKSLDSIGHSYFSNTDSQENIYSSGAVVVGAPSTFLASTIRNTSDELFAYINSDGLGGSVVTNTSSLGYYSFSRTSSTLLNGYKNGVFYYTDNLPSTTAPNANLYLLSMNNSALYSARQYNCYALHEGLNPTESLALYNAVNKFKTTLGI